MTQCEGLQRLTRAIGYVRISTAVFLWPGRERFPVLLLGMVKP